MFSSLVKILKLEKAYYSAKQISITLTHSQRWLAQISDHKVLIFKRWLVFIRETGGRQKMGLTIGGIEKALN